MLAPDVIEGLIRLFGIVIFVLLLVIGLQVWLHFAQYQGEDGDDDGPHRSAD